MSKQHLTTDDKKGSKRRTGARPGGTELTIDQAGRARLADGPIVTIGGGSVGAEASHEVFKNSDQPSSARLTSVLARADGSSRSHLVTRLQRTYGNLTVQRLLTQGIQRRQSGGSTTPTGQKVVQRAGPFAVAGLGVAIFSAGAPIILGGNLSSHCTTVNYVHEHTPPDIQWKRAEVEFEIAMVHPKYWLPFIAGWGPQRFFFRLSYEYNGHDLRDVSIVCLQDRSSSMITSSFSITFTGQPYSVKLDPVAEIKFQISGTWNPYGCGIDSFWGYLRLKANRKAQFQINDERSWIRKFKFGEYTIQDLPAPPKPLQVTPFHKVYFDTGLDRIEAGSEGELVSWYMRLLQETRDQIEAGTLPIVLKGHASTTQPGPANRLLSRRRVQKVRKILQDIAGSDAQFKVFAYGEYKAGTPDQVEEPEERRVDVEVTYNVPILGAPSGS